MNRIVETEVWCVANSEDHIRLGLPEGDSWMQMSIDFKSIIAIKLSGETEFLGNDKATIYFGYGASLTINITYQEAINIWQKVLSE
jgi:hypothetical protein